eukprot:m51a1_g6353 hypothetical protein (394) ;mRNA; r:85629-86883
MRAASLHWCLILGGLLVIVLVSEQALLSSRVPRQQPGLAYPAESFAEPEPHLVDLLFSKKHKQKLYPWNAVTFPRVDTPIDEGDITRSLRAASADALAFFQTLNESEFGASTLRITATAEFLAVGERKSSSDLRFTASVEGAALDVARAAVKRSLRSAALASPKCVFLDVGANVGSFGLIAARLGCGVVVAVEPQRHMAAMLAMSAAINGFTNLHVVRRAVHEVAGRGVSMQVPVDGVETGGAAFIQEGKANEFVTTTRIDELKVPAQSPVALLKIDTEGFEVRSLLGATGILPRVNNMLVEWGPVSRWTERAGHDAGKAVEVVRMLDRMGFQLCALPYVGIDGCKLYDKDRTITIDGVSCTPYPASWPDRESLLTQQEMDCSLWWWRPTFWK